jgi:hypothetical protein
LGRLVLHQGKGSFILMELTNKSTMCGAKITLESEDVKIASDVHVLFFKTLQQHQCLEIMNKLILLIYFQSSFVGINDK